MPADNARSTEHRARRTQGWMWDEAALDYVEFGGIALWWRFVGERRWRKHTLIPQGGQTVDGLLAKADLIVGRMAERETRRDAAA